MSAKKDFYSQAVCELGASKLFLAAILLDLFSFLISVVYYLLNIIEMINDSQRGGTENLFTALNACEVISLILDALIGIALLRTYLSFKRNAPNTKALERVIYYSLISSVLLVISFALTFKSLLYVLAPIAAVICLFIFLATRKTIKLAIAFLEQDIAGILKYKASILLLIFIIYTAVFNLVNALGAIGVATLLSLPALAALIIYAILLFKFRIIANTGTKKANKHSDRKAKRIDL